MDSAARCDLVREIGATIAAAPGPLLAAQAITRRLAACCEATVTLWSYGTPAVNDGGAVVAGPLRYLAGDRHDLAGLPIDVPETVLQRLLATNRAVPGLIDHESRAELIIPVLGLGRLQGVLQLRAIQRRVPLLDFQAPLEEVAPILGALLHALALDNTLRVNLTVDDLTGLANNRHLSELIDRELSRARRTRRLLALLLIQIDRFEALQVEFGPATGDRALTALAATLRSSCRDDDVFGRYTLDQFLALLPESNGWGARAAANRLLHRLNYYPIALPDGRLHHLSASIGTAIFPVDGLVIRELVESAALALTAAQLQGGNRAVEA